MALVFRRTIALVLLVLTIAGALGIAAGARSDATPEATPDAPAVVLEVINEGCGVARSG